MRLLLYGNCQSLLLIALFLYIYLFFCHKIAPYYMGPKHTDVLWVSTLVHLCLTLRGIQTWWYVCIFVINIGLDCFPQLTTNNLFFYAACNVPLLGKCSSKSFQILFSGIHTHTHTLNKPTPPPLPGPPTSTNLRHQMCGDFCKASLCIRRTWPAQYHLSLK